MPILTESALFDKNTYILIKKKTYILTLPNVTENSPKLSFLQKRTFGQNSPFTRNTDFVKKCNFDQIRTFSAKPHILTKKKEHLDINSHSDKKNTF